jgi:DNA helicase-2/ATP-dependent DNA helicase PcrA
MYGSRDKQLPSRFIEEMGIISEASKRTVFDAYNDRYSDNYYNDYSSNMGRYSSSSNYVKSNYGEATTYPVNKSYSSNTYSTYDDYASKLNSFNSKKLSDGGTGGLGKLQGLMSNKLNTQKNNTDGYKVGVKVLHAKFGVGTIVKVDGGDNSYVSIDFGKLGVKTLSLNIAPLQILK